MGALPIAATSMAIPLAYLPAKPMRRADRLFEIIQLLRGGRLLTAQHMGARLEVSERTIYRDIADLKANGVPIDGEAGVGYILRAGYHVPPLMFTTEEVAALAAAIGLATPLLGLELAAAANEALIKIEAVLPQNTRHHLNRSIVKAHTSRLPAQQRQRIDLIERATRTRLKLDLDYLSLAQIPSKRTVRPLGLWLWDRGWTFGAWCELRGDFRHFRVDRVQNLVETGECFFDEKGKTLTDLYRTIARDAQCPPFSQTDPLDRETPPLPSKDVPTG